MAVFPILHTGIGYLCIPTNELLLLIYNNLQVTNVEKSIQNHKGERNSERVFHWRKKNTEGKQGIEQIKRRLQVKLWSGKEQSGHMF